MRKAYEGLIPPVLLADGYPKFVFVAVTVGFEMIPCTGSDFSPLEQTILTTTPTGESFVFFFNSLADGRKRAHRASTYHVYRVLIYTLDSST